MHRISWTKSDQIWQNDVKGDRQKNVKKKQVYGPSVRSRLLAGGPTGWLRPFGAYLTSSFHVHVHQHYFKSSFITAQGGKNRTSLLLHVYIFIIIEQWQNLESPLYIPLESPRVEVVDIDLKFPNEVEPRRYPRLRKCVSMERSVPADTRVEIYKQLLVSKYFTWKGSQICGGDHSHTCRG